MRKALSFLCVGVLAAEALILGQGGDAAKVIAAAREALGGDKKLAAVTSLSATGTNARSTGQTSTGNQFEMALVLPDKFMRKDVLGNFNGQNIARTSGFNGSGLVEAMDMPQLGGSGQMFMRATGPAGGAQSISSRPGTGAETPEERAAIRKAGILAAKQDLARMTLGMFPGSLEAYPLTFTYAGTADSPDGKADIVEAKGEGDFDVKLFVDQQSHLPLMISWMAKEPISMGGASGAPATSTKQLGNGASITTFGGSGAGAIGGQMTPEELTKLQEQARQKLADAQARARTVEYRVFYGGYQAVDGVKLPTRFTRSIDGNATEELTIETYKINPKVDLKKFEVAKDK